MKQILLAFLISLQISTAQAKPAPAVAGIASIIPGLGQTLNGNAFEGLAYAGVSALYFHKNGYLSNIGFNIWLYNQYDAYRDAGAKNAAQNSVYENYLANINPLNIVDLVAAPTVGFAAGYGAYLGGYPAFQRWEIPVSYGFVGLGEEAAFRGFYYHGFSRLFGSTVVGAILSSAGFAYAHVIGGTENLQPMALAQRFGFGLLMCWQITRNNYDLRKNIFTHSWYDIFIDRGDSIGFRMTIPLIP